jgi:hypothetical protein
MGPGMEKTHSAMIQDHHQRANRRRVTMVLARLREIERAAKRRANMVEAFPETVSTYMRDSVVELYTLLGELETEIRIAGEPFKG